MGAVKELFIDAHDRLIEKYMEDHPEASEEEACLATEDHAWGAMADQAADEADRLRDQAKDQQMERADNAG